MESASWLYTPDIFYTGIFIYCLSALWHCLFVLFIKNALFIPLCMWCYAILVWMLFYFFIYFIFVIWLPKMLEQMDGCLNVNHMKYCFFYSIFRWVQFLISVECCTQIIKCFLWLTLTYTGEFHFQLDSFV